MREGVIQFTAHHHAEPLRPGERDAAAALLGWRAVLRDLRLIGADPARYGGLGFGNISHRVGPRSATRGSRPFVISGSQTSGVAAATHEHFACVDAWSLRDNDLHSRGPVLPSSEALTHATIYDEGPHLQTVLHVHSPEIWRAHKDLRLETTPPGVDYGTVAMAEATARLFRAGRVLETGIYVMLGHDDGVVAFGRDPDEAGTTLVRVLATARAAARP